MWPKDSPVWRTARTVAVPRVIDLCDNVPLTVKWATETGKVQSRRCIGAMALALGEIKRGDVTLDGATWDVSHVPLTEYLG